MGFQSHLEFPLDPESEFDCLNLFVVRPSQTALAGLGRGDPALKLPVLVWIHGGGYGFGAATDPMWGMCAPIVLNAIHKSTVLLKIVSTTRSNSSCLTIYTHRQTHHRSRHQLSP
jgi:Carboxylesterase family